MVERLSFAPSAPSFEFLRTGHDARGIADSLIRKGLDVGRALTPLQIIKLVYFCHGWSLGLYGKPLSRQYVHAWMYGPVIPAVYRALRSYGGEPVMSPIAATNVQFDEMEDNLVTQVFEKYGHLPGTRLSRLTHAYGTPWHTIWTRKGRDAVIPDELIEGYYADLAKRGRRTVLSGLRLTLAFEPCLDRMIRNRKTPVRPSNSIWPIGKTLRFERGGWRRRTTSTSVSRPCAESLPGEHGGSCEPFAVS